MIRTALAVVFVVACSGSPGGPSMHNSINTPDPTPQSSPVISADILAREPLSNVSQIKHILIGWNDSGDESRRDPRAAKRTKKDAEDQVRDLVKQLAAGADFDALMKQWSEDPGSASSGRAYPVSPDASLVIEFKQLGLRLKVNEIGVVQSEFGFHIMKRVEYHWSCTEAIDPAAAGSKTWRRPSDRQFRIVREIDRDGERVREPRRQVHGDRPGERDDAEDRAAAAFCRLERGDHLGCRRSTAGCRRWASRYPSP